jgi:hypothetical protein
MILKIPTRPQSFCGFNLVLLPVGAGPEPDLLMFGSGAGQFVIDLLIFKPLSPLRQPMEVAMKQSEHLARVVRPFVDSKWPNRNSNQVRTHDYTSRERSWDHDVATDFIKADPQVVEKLSAKYLDTDPRGRDYYPAELARLHIAVAVSALSDETARDLKASQLGAVYKTLLKSWEILGAAMTGERHAEL